MVILPCVQSSSPHVGCSVMKEGKFVLVTGAARRIGRSISLASARSGFDVAVHYQHSHAEAETLCSEIRALGRQAIMLQADLAQEKEVQALIPRILGHGSLVALVNNASIFEPLDWENTGIEDWNHHLMVNVTAPFLLSQAFARALAPTMQGRIINLLDWRFSRPVVDHFPYTISKSALASLTQSLAVALAPHITVNALALGAVLPPSDGNTSKTLLNNVPLGRWATLDEVDEAFTFLLNGPPYMTGEILSLDGGRHLV